MRSKFAEWGKRYVPAEIAAAACAIASASGTFHLTGNRIAAAYAGALGDIVGFFFFIFAREIYYGIKHHDNSNHFVARGIKTVRNLIVEFGPSELVDNFFVRPFFMYVFPLKIYNYKVAIFIAKIAADSVYYIFAIFFYELRKKYLK